MKQTPCLLLVVLLALGLAACGGGDDDAGPDARASFERAEQVVEAGKKYTATIRTSKGDIVVDLYADIAPHTVNSFVFLAQQGFFDGLTFHRVVKDFVIQGGDPAGNGSGDPGYETADEPNERSNTRGTLSMAKSPGAKEFGSQFFINLRDNTGLDYDSPSRDKFYPFGEVVQGMDVVDAIGNSPVDSNDRPNPPVTIQSVTVRTN